MTRLRVVAVTYSPGAALGDFLSSLRLAITEPYAVTLADNGSTDGIPAQAAATHPEVGLLELPANLGYGRAANAGAVEGDEPWLLVANPDVTFDAGSLDVLLAATERHPRGGSFGPAIRTLEGDLYPSARAFPSLVRGIGHALLGWWWPGNPFTRAYRNERGTPVEGPTGWLSGSCLLLRRAAFDAVGGFDPTYFMYFEDLDLCKRLALAGWENIHVPAALVTHSGGHATQRDATVAHAMLQAHHRSAYQYLSRQYDGWWRFPVRLALRAGLAARGLLGRISPTVGAGAKPTRSAAVLGTSAARVNGGDPGPDPAP